MKFSAQHYESLKTLLKLYFKTAGQMPQEWRKQARFEGRSETYFIWECLWGSMWIVVYREEHNNSDYKDSHLETAAKKAIKELSEDKELLTTPLPFKLDVIQASLATYTKYLPLTLTQKKEGGYTFVITEPLHMRGPNSEQLQQIANQLAPIFDCVIHTTGELEITFLTQDTKPFGDWEQLEEKVIETV